MPMVRKKLYIEERQETALKHMAARRGVTEAEVVREAIDRAEALAEPAHRPDPSAWTEFEAFVRRLRRRTPAPPAARRWTRDELYTERTSGRGRAD